MTGAIAQQQRLDKFLVYARLCKTRSRAARLCQDGGVRIDGAVVTDPARRVRPGNIIELDLGKVSRRIIVIEIGARRGPAVAARTLYDEQAAARRPAPTWDRLLPDIHED